MVDNIPDVQVNQKYGEIESIVHIFRCKNTILYLEKSKFNIQYSNYLLDLSKLNKTNELNIIECPFKSSDVSNVFDFFNLISSSKPIKIKLTDINDILEWFELTHEFYKMIICNLIEYDRDLFELFSDTLCNMPNYRGLYYIMASLHDAELFKKYKSM